MSRSSSDYRFVDLTPVPATVVSGRRIDWLQARVGEGTSSPLAVVDYTIDGQRQKYGLRLDLGKQSFVDTPVESQDDVELDRAVTRSIVETIVGGLQEVTGTSREGTRTMFGKKPKLVHVG